MDLQYLPVAILSETMQITTETNLSVLAMISNYFKKDFQKVEPNQENLVIKAIIKRQTQYCLQLTILAVADKIQRT